MFLMSCLSENELGYLTASYPRIYISSGLETSISTYGAKSNAAQYMLHISSSPSCLSLAYSWYKTPPRSKFLSQLRACAQEVYKSSSPQPWICRQVSNNSTDTHSTLPRSTSYFTNRREGTEPTLGNGANPIKILSIAQDGRQAKARRVNSTEKLDQYPFDEQQDSDKQEESSG